ncbi:hypothetical protein B5807_11773 [Epicoccum nigrum]|uniref:Uncharacterized protein n=1 Tax=Epicoccum nigrum TaxID=105696 RepID=A0A1Y2LHS4_EPING|nr:hypothetical protein B5807_11773 [Epicoccum nigrum]
MTRPSKKRKSADYDEDKQHKRACPHETSLAAESTSQAGTLPFTSPQKQKSSKSKDDDKGKIDTRVLYEQNKKEIDQWYDEYISRKSGIPMYGRVVHSKDRWFNKVDAWMKDRGIAQTLKKVNNAPQQTKTTVQETRETREISPDDLKPHHKRYPGDKVRVPEYPFDKLSDFTRGPNGRFACAHAFETTQDCCKNGLSAAGKKSGIKKDIKAWRCRVEMLIDKKDLDERHKTWEDWVNEKLIKKYQPERWKQREEETKGKIRKKREAQKKERGLAEMSEGACDKSDDEEPPRAKRQKTTPPNPADQPANIERDSPHQHQDLPQPRPSSTRTNMQNSEGRSQPRHKNRKGRRSRARDKQSEMVQQSDGVLVEPVAARPATTQPQTQASMPMTQVQTVQSPVGQEPGSIPEENDDSATESAYLLPAGMWDFDKLDNELERFLSLLPLLDSADQTDAPLPPDNFSDEGSVIMSAWPNYDVSTITALLSDCSAHERSQTMSTWLNYADQMAALPSNSPADEQFLFQTVDDCKADWQRYCDFMDEHDGEEEL